jgi:hypothetical protein
LGPITFEFTFGPIRSFHNWDFFLKSHPLIALKRFSRKLYILKPWITSHLGKCHNGPLGYTKYMVEVFWKFANMAHSFMALGKATTPCSLLVLTNIINYCKVLLIVFENTFPHGRCFHHLKAPCAIHMQNHPRYKKCFIHYIRKSLLSQVSFNFSAYAYPWNYNLQIKEGLRWRPSFIHKICTSW